MIKAMTCHLLPMHQLITLLCYKKKKAPHEIRGGSATADNQFAYFTPLNSKLVYTYQWSTEKWNQLPLSPYWNSGLVIINGELTAVGGWDAESRTNKLFTLQQGQWVEHYPPMNTARSSPAVVSTPDGNYILVIGGKVAVSSWTTAFELLDVRSRRWYRLTNLPQSLIQPSATICGNQIHVIGENRDGYSCFLQAILSGDQPIILNILTWTPLPQQPVTLSTAATVGRKLIIVGGQQNGSQVNSIHQLRNGQWVKIGFMSAAIARSKCLVVTPSPDKIMIVGGYGGAKRVEECTL